MKIYADKLSPAAQEVFLKMIINTRVHALMQHNDAEMAAIDEIDRLYVKACVATKLAESCRYCGGNCPNEPDNSEFLCDGFAGDIDNLYSND